MTKPEYLAKKAELTNETDQLSQQIELADEYIDSLEKRIANLETWLGEVGLLIEDHNFDDAWKICLDYIPQ